MNIWHTRLSLIVFTLLLWCFPSLASALELKVDINNNGRQYTEGTDPAFTPWSTEYAWFVGGDTTSETFDGVTVTFTRVGSNGSALKPSYWKSGVIDQGAKLAGDGIKVDNDDSGAAQIEMRLSGLTAGSHTLLTYHNDWDNHDVSDVAPLNITVDDVLAVSDLAMTIRAIASTDAATAYLELEAVEDEDVVILFAADTTTSASTQNVWINGFEIDTPNSILKAIEPYPENDDEYVDADDHSLSLTWTAAGSAISHDVYLGTDSNAVKAATHRSSSFMGNQTDTVYTATNISSLLTYYWRVDEVDSSGTVTPGDVWTFRPRHLAFPGAEGHGRFARGGRGGVVAKVTNLNDSGPGSLRNALKGDYGPRTVIFDVSGLITLESDLIITGDDRYITVAGQTAPGWGICVKQYQLGASGADDLIMRFMRSRPGDISGETLNGSGMAGVDHSIMDHCSISWGIDEEMSTRGAENVTLQRTMLAEALNIAGHKNYSYGTKHGYAASVGGDIASLHHNLLAHCEGRNWSLAGGLDGSGHFAGRLDIRNNVVYNWGHKTTEGGAHQVNFVNNYYKPGPAQDSGTAAWVALYAQYGNFPGTQQYYFAGNLMPGSFDLTNQEDGRYATTENGGSLPTDYSPWVDEPFFEPNVTTQTAQNAFKNVLSDVGCTLPQIDPHDERVIQETLDGTTTYTGSVSGIAGLPDSQEDVGAWDAYPTVTRAADWDTDNDGLPNWWELIHGLDPNSEPNDFSEGNADPDGDEYTNLEDYLNWMAEPHVDCDVNGTVDIDLASLTRGYTDTDPVYSIDSVSSGTVTLLDDGTTARFTPTVNEDTLGSFSFTVIDSEDDSMTRRVNLRIMESSDQ